MLRTAIALAFVVSAAPAAAAEAPSSKPVTQKICKFVPATGWRLTGVKVCKTKAQWDEQARDAQKELRDTAAPQRSGSN